MPTPLPPDPTGNDEDGSTETLDAAEILDELLEDVLVPEAVGASSIDDGSAAPVTEQADLTLREVHTAASVLLNFLQRADSPLQVAPSFARDLSAVQLLFTAAIADNARASQGSAPLALPPLNLQHIVAPARDEVASDTAASVAMSAEDLDTVQIPAEAPATLSVAAQLPSDAPATLPVAVGSLLGNVDDGIGAAAAANVLVPVLGAVSSAPTTAPAQLPPPVSPPTPPLTPVIARSDKRKSSSPRAATEHGRGHRGKKKKVVFDPS